MSSDLIAVLSEGTFEDLVLDLSAFLSRSKPESERNDYIAAFTAEAEQAAESQDKRKEVLNKVVDQLSGLGEGTDRELEGIYNLLVALIISNFEDGKARSALLERLATTIAKDGNPDRSAIKYRILANLFNSLPRDASLRLDVFRLLLDIASAQDELEYLSDALSSVPRWLATWHGVDVASKASLLRTVAQRLEAADQPARAHEFRLAYLRSLASSDSDDAREAAEECVAAALRQSKVEVAELEPLLAIDAVQALAKTSPATLALLKVFVSGGQHEWSRWFASNGSELAKLGLKPEDLARKIKLLELASLFSRSVSAEVPYSQIADVVQVDESQVETWVIDVIRAGLVSGKLSQVNRTFRVYRSTHRTFGPEQWRTLEERLTHWKSSIENILATLEAASPGANNATATAGEGGVGAGYEASGGGGGGGASGAATSAGRDRRGAPASAAAPGSGGQAQPNAAAQLLATAGA